jgi:hypothetical protein
MTTYTSSLRLVQPADGAANWGTTVNTGLTALVDTSVAGTATITMTAADYTLTNNNGAADEARAMVLNLTGTPGAARNVICPAVSKVYIVYNNTTGGFAQTIKTAAGSGVLVPSKSTVIVRCDGTNVVGVVNNQNFNILDFGAVRGSAANQTAVIQAAIDTVSSSGGGELLIPDGTFFVSALAMKSNVTLVGQSKNAVLKMFSVTGVLSMITATTVSGIGFRNLTIDLNNATGTDGNGAIAFYVTSTGVAGVNNVTIENVSFINNLTGLSVASRPFISIQPSFTSRNYRIENCSFSGRQCIRFLPNYVPSAAPTDTGCGNWFIQNNVARDCVQFLQIRHGGTQAFDQFDSVVVANNQVYAVPDYITGASSSPYEIFCVTSLTVTGNTVYTGARGFNATFVKDATYDSNSTYDQTKYFMELANSDGVTISGNTAYNCKSFVNDTGIYAPGSKNINIVGNTIAGGNTGEAGYDQFIFGSCITMQPTFTYSNWRVADNLFIDLLYTSSVIRIDGTTTGYAVENNTFFCSTASQQVTAIEYVAGSNVIIRDNVIRRTSNISDTTLGVLRTGSCTNGSAVVTNIASGQSQLTSQTTPFVSAGMLVTGSGIPAGTTILSVDSPTQVTLSANYTGITGTQSLVFVAVTVDAFIYLQVSSTGSNVVVDNNIIQWTGSDTRTGIANTGAIGIGANLGVSSALTKLSVKNNSISGAFAGTTGTSFAAVRLPLSAGDTFYQNNDLSGVTSGTESLNAAIVYRRTKREFEGTAAPAAGTYLLGDRVWNSTPAVGQPKSWVCTTAGTPGTWTSEGNL